MMPGSYNDEFEDDEQKQPQSARLGLSSSPPQVMMQAPTVVMPAPPDPRQELQRRLDLAQVYQSLLSEPLFDKETVSSKQVTEEIRNFIYGRLQALVGGPSAASKGGGDFTVEEVAALKAIARSLLARKGEQPPPELQPAVATPPAPRKSRKKEPKQVEVKPPEPVRVRRQQAPPSLSQAAATPPPQSGPPATPVAPDAAALTTAPAPVAVDGTPVAGAASVGAEGKVLSQRSYKIRVVGEDGVVREKEVRLNVAKQALPVNVSMHKTLVTQQEQNMANMNAEIEAQDNAEGFTTGFERAPRVRRELYRDVPLAR